MRISSISIASAMTAALSLSALASPEGFDNAAGYWFGGILNASPFLNLSYYRDDNANSLRKYSADRAREVGKEKQTDKADTFQIKGGLNLLLPGNHWRLDGRAYVQNESYSKADVDDRTDYYESLILKGWTDAGTSWHISERYQDVRYDDDFELSSNDRKSLNIDAGGEMAATDKSKIMVGVNYLDYDYDERKENNYSCLGGHLGFAHALTEKTDWTLSGSYRTYDRDGYDSNAYGVNGMVGLRTRSTDKLTFNTSVGAEYYRDYKYSIYADDGTYLGKQSKGKDDSSFVYRLGGNWKMAKRLSLNVSGYSQYEPSQDASDNSLFANQISAILTYKVGDSWKLTTGISYERDEYNRKVIAKKDIYGNPYSAAENGDRKRKDDEIRYFATVAYAFTKYCSVYATYRYTDISSSLDEYEYDRTRYGAGISLKY